MRRLLALCRRLTGTFSTSARDRELDEEFDALLQLHTDANVRAGMAPAEARRRAILALGGLEQSKEAYRDRRGFPVLAHLLQDVRYGARALRRNPGFSTAAILTLALGLGANMAVFRFVEGVLLKSLPVAEPDHLVVLRPPFNYPAFRDFTAVTRDVFAGTAARWGIPVNFSTAGTTELLPAELVSGSYFGTLRVQPALGRLLDEEDDGAEGAHPVCVISYGLWQRRFGGDPAVLGRIVELNAAPFEIVGVTERGFRGTDLHQGYELQIPMSMTALFADTRDSPSWTWLMIMARLAPGVTREQAEAAVRATFNPPFEWQKSLISLVDGRQGFASLRDRLEDPALMAQLLAGCVLLLACANLAGLLLAKTSARRRELAVRQSLGAWRGRIITALLVESVLLAGIAAGVGAILAILLDGVLTAMLSSPGSNLEVGAPSSLVFAVSVALMVLAAFAIGLLPALAATREAPLEGLRDAPLTRTGITGNWLARGLIVGQLVISLVLVFAAGLFALSLRNLRSIDLGLDPDQVVVMTADPARSGYARERSAEFHDEWLRRAHLVPGVSSASLALITAMSGAMFAGPVAVPDAEPRGGPEPNNNINVISPEYFRTVGLPILAGRAFSDADGPNAPRVAIVNERFVEYYWPDRSPIGRQFTLFSQTPVEVIGVVRTAKYTDIREEPQITIYLPLAQRLLTELTLHARVAGSTDAAAAALRQAVLDVDPRVPVYNAGLLEEHVNARLSNERVLNLLSTFFAALAVIVAAAGLYGLVAYAVARRRREVGIRLAVGAQSADILTLFLKDVGVLVAIGIAAGIPLAYASGQRFGSLLYGLEPWSLSILLMAAALLGAVSLAAAAIPAAAALRVDPVATLRE